MEVQERRELELISSFKKCNVRGAIQNIDQLKQRLIEEDLDKRFYDASIMSTLFCVFDVLLYAPSESTLAEMGEFPETSSEIYDVFDKLRRIGAESEDGVALLAGFGELDNMFIIKAPKDPLKDEMFHEYFIGVTTTNPMRSFVPNYAYIFGAFKCQPPIVAEDKRVTQWCGRGNRDTYVNYIVYEKIPGKEMKEMCKTCTFPEYLSWFIQLALALQMGAEKRGFTHYDLHSENVLMRDWIYDDFAIPYDTPFGIVYIRTNKISTMIDFGRSHAVVNGESFGVYGFEEYGAFPDVTRPWYDLYKILMFSMYDMLKSKNTETLEEALPLLQLIIDRKFAMTQDQLFEQINEERRTFFVFSDIVMDIEKPGPREITLWDYLAEVEGEYPDLWPEIVLAEPPSSVPILECDEFKPNLKGAAEAINGCGKVSAKRYRK